MFPKDRYVSEKMIRLSVINFHQKYNRLVHVSNCLGDVMSNKNLSQIIITRHVGDVLAAYIQLSYAPLKKPTEASPSDENVDKSEFVMTQELFNRFTQDQKHFEARLKSLIEKVNKIQYHRKYNFHVQIYVSI